MYFPGHFSIFFPKSTRNFTGFPTESKDFPGVSNNDIVILTGIIKTKGKTQQTFVVKIINNINRSRRIISGNKDRSLCVWASLKTLRDTLTKLQDPYRDISWKITKNKDFPGLMGCDILWTFQTKVPNILFLFH